MRSKSARAEIEAVAAEATQEMVARLTGIKVDRKEAARRSEGGTACLSW